MMRGGNADLLRQMQNRLAKIQEELAGETIEVSAGGGAIKITISGQQHVEAVRIDPSVIDPDDVEMLQDLMVAAINEAINESQQLAAKRLGGLTGGMKIPGLM
jgi:DNA-binding YbaB/EbfC family protein